MSLTQSNTAVVDFVRESNRIEGIDRDPTQNEIEMHMAFIGLNAPGREDLATFVESVAGAKLRIGSTMNVRVGNHTPPQGGKQLLRDLDDLLVAMHRKRLTPYEAHTRYETLHPFMDGNGRSGRALWAWHMRHIGANPFSLPFLHRFYYQSLDASHAP